MKTRIIPALLGVLSIVLLAGCQPKEEYSADELAALKVQGSADILKKTVSRPKPAPGDEPYEIGKPGGTWLAGITSDPKTFNTLTARDGDSREVIDVLYDYLVDYDPLTKEFIPRVAESFRVETDEAAGTMDVFFTLRRDIWWTTPDGKVREKVTADDVVFWYDGIEGDQDLQMPGYASQFVTMPDGSKERTTIEKTGTYDFVFHYPRIVANPFLMSNMSFGPRFVFEKAKKEGGAEALLEIFGVDTDPRTIPSMGPYHITEYTPGVRVVLTRNPDYWKKDKKGNPLPYKQEIIMKIIPNRNTEYLLFQNGETDGYSLRPEDLPELTGKENADYTVFNGGPSEVSAFLCFNQNPDNLPEHLFKWFALTEFRQAMSCLVNRDRIAAQVHRGLAQPAEYFFSRSNPFFDPGIKQEFSYNPKRAVKILKKAGFRQNGEGTMLDPDGKPVEFNLFVGVENNVGVDTANIFADECARVGIKVNVKPIDFQKLVDMIMNTYDWEAVMVSLGANNFPEMGSNVWQSSGNFHLWRPLQKEPATDWEARIDYLYNEGAYTADHEKAEKVWNEYQRIILDQCPFIYLVYPNSFMAVRNKWGNVYYDSLTGSDSLYYYLTE
jgi:peptide/nickel transport system substrate-binding protein